MSSTFLLYNPEHSIYPGEYVPLVKEDDIKETLRRPHESNIIHPPVNVTELTDSYKIEIAVPGAKSEEFLVHCDENVLTVCVVHKEKRLQEPVSFPLHEFNYECFERHILLPENADAAFANAEYKAGILRLHIPKTKWRSKNQHTRIAVY